MISWFTSAFLCGLVKSTIFGFVSFIVGRFVAGGARENPRKELMSAREEMPGAGCVLGELSHLWAGPASESAPLVAMFVLCWLLINIYPTLNFLSQPIPHIIKAVIEL